MNVASFTTPTSSTLADLAFVLLGAARELQLHHSHDPQVVQLTATEINVLRHVEDHPGSAPAAIAEAIGLRRSNLSAALRTLEGKELVERRPDTADRRSHRLHPTPAAADNLTRMRALWAEAVERALGGDLSGLEDTVTLLGRLEAGLADANKFAATAEKN